MPATSKRTIPAPRQERQRIFRRAVVHAERDDAARFGPQHTGIAPPGRVPGHPVHVAVTALGDERIQVWLGVGAVFGGREAYRVEAETQRFATNSVPGIGRGIHT